MGTPHHSNPAPKPSTSHARSARWAWWITAGVLVVGLVTFRSLHLLYARGVKIISTSEPGVFEDPIHNAVLRITCGNVAATAFLVQGAGGHVFMVAPLHCLTATPPGGQMMIGRFVRMRNPQTGRWRAAPIIHLDTTILATDFERDLAVVDVPGVPERLRVLTLGGVPQDGSPARTVRLPTDLTSESAHPDMPPIREVTCTLHHPTIPGVVPDPRWPGELALRSPDKLLDMTCTRGGCAVQPCEMDEQIVGAPVLVDGSVRAVVVRVAGETTLRAVSGDFWAALLARAATAREQEAAPTETASNALVQSAWAACRASEGGTGSAIDMDFLARSDLVEVHRLAEASVEDPTLSMANRWSQREDLLGNLMERVSHAADFQAFFDVYGTSRYEMCSRVQDFTTDFRQSQHDCTARYLPALMSGWACALTRAHAAAAMDSPRVEPVSGGARTAGRERWVARVRSGTARFPIEFVHDPTGWRLHLGSHHLTASEPVPPRVDYFGAWEGLVPAAGGALTVTITPGDEPPGSIVGVLVERGQSRRYLCAVRPNGRLVCRLATDVGLPAPLAFSVRPTNDGADAVELVTVAASRENDTTRYQAWEGRLTRRHPQAQASRAP